MAEPITDKQMTSWTDYLSNGGPSPKCNVGEMIHSAAARIRADAVVIAELQGEVKGLRASVDYLKGEQR